MVPSAIMRADATRNPFPGTREINPWGARMEGGIIGVGWVHPTVRIFSMTNQNSDQSRQQNQSGKQDQQKTGQQTGQQQGQQGQQGKSSQNLSDQDRQNKGGSSQNR